jgi:membrane protease YdiL (CAAX protease family)
MVVEAKSGLLKRYPLVTYFVLAYAISWAFWLPLAASSHDLIPIYLPAVVFYTLAALGPVLAAVIVSGIEGGKPAIRALLGKVLKWRVGVRWYLAALLGYPALCLAGSGLDVLLGGNPSSPSSSDLAGLHMPFWFLLVIMPPFVLGEEIGWRGYALPRIQAGRSALLASIILSVLWGLWHVPSFLMRNSLHQGQPFLLWMVWLFLMTVVLTWLYNSTGGSVLIAWFYHVAMNYAGFLTPATMRGRVIGSVFILMAVVAIVTLAGPARLSKSGKEEHTGIQNVS